MSFTDLTVNLLDPEDVREKAGRLRALIEAREAEVKQLQAERERWARLLARLEALDLSDDPPASTNGAKANGAARSRAEARMKPGSTQDIATHIVLEMDRPMRTSDVMEVMARRGHGGPSRGAVNTALWASEKQGLLSKPEPGVYAPPGYAAKRLPGTEGGGS